MTTNTLTENDVLNEFALAFTTPNTELLSSFIRQYPEHRESLAEFAAELSADAHRKRFAAPLDLTRTTETVARAMSRYSSRLYDKEHPAAVADVPNPLATKTKSEAGMIIKELRLTRKLYAEIRDRTILGDSMPAPTRAYLANGIGTDVAIFSAHLAAPPVLNAGARLKADAKPELPKKRTWEEAVRASGLSEEDQEWLLNR